jgi:cytochrome c peroxidase
MTRPSRSAKRVLLVSLVIVLPALTAGGFGVHAQTLTYTCPGGFTEMPALPLVLLTSLKTIPNPVISRTAAGVPAIRADLVDYVANLDAAIRLGKALFWDMQAGSDNKVACATCHFQAGQDGRTRNQLNPGPDAQWQTGGVNADITPALYPFTTPGAADTDNATGSQGVRKSEFGGISRSGGESTSAVADPVFNVGGKNVRQVTGKNTPSAINAVFNHRNFFDGRAQNEFNGVNPFGDRDATARVWYVGPLGPTQIDIHMKDAALASQAVGPPLNDVEMSANGRTFPDIGHKLMALKPLGLQRVDPTDSVLGPLADSPSGLKTTYAGLIQQAFKPKWWNTTKSVKLSSGTYSMTEANMSLFWGLSVMLYEATLVSDDTPMDRYLASRALGSTVGDATLLNDVVARLQADVPGLTRDHILHGLALFELPVPPAPAPTGVGCSACHAGAELTSASVRNLTAGVEALDANFKGGGFDLRMERMFMQIPPVPLGTDLIVYDPATYTVTAANTITNFSRVAPVSTYDVGWYNIGVRPTTDDLGLGRKDPFGNFFSWTQKLQAIADPSIIKVPGGTVACGGINLNNASGYPLLSGSLHANERTDVAGTFKVPQLRNVELNAPYFHNGGRATLAQLVEFYDDGGNFANPTLAPLIRPLGLTADDRRDLVAFLLTLTDERVRFQRAPFDHPQLFVANGDTTPGTDNTIEIPATGAAGGVELLRFLGLNPFTP